MSFQEPPVRSRRGRLLGWLIVLCIAVAAAWWYTAGKHSASPGPSASAPGGRGMGPGGFRAMTVPVRVATIGEQTLQHTLRAIGTVTAFNTVVVRSQVGGELVRLHFKDGQHVQAGDVLAEIDPRPFQVALDQARGQQQQNAAQLQSARRDLERYRLLFRQNSIARQQVEQQEALVKQLEGASLSDQAAVDSAELQLGYATVTAPISGRLGLRKVDEGNIVSASDVEGLVTITQNRPISVAFSLPQSELGDVLTGLREGRTLEAVLYDQGNVTELARGELMSVDNMIDVATGTVRLKARFENEDERLFPNQFVNLRLRVSSRSGLAVPSAAVQYGSIGSYVYVVDDTDTVQIRRIVTGLVDGSATALLEGLKPGERVVVEGTDRLREGSKVEVVSVDGQAPATTAGPDARPSRQKPGREGAGPAAASGARPAAPATAAH